MHLILQYCPKENIAIACPCSIKFVAFELFEKHAIACAKSNASILYAWKIKPSSIEHRSIWITRSSSINLNAIHSVENEWEQCCCLWAVPCWQIYPDSCTNTCVSWRQIFKVFCMKSDHIITDPLLGLQSSRAWCIWKWNSKGFKGEKCHGFYTIC